MVRFPRLYERLAVAVSGLGPRSRLRRSLVRRGTVSGWAAFSRRDFELMTVRYAPDVEFQFSPGLQTLGLNATYRGRAAMLDGLRELAAEWDPIELDPAYVVDLGDVVVNLGYIRARGRTSGVRVDTELAQVLVLRQGLVASDRGR